MFKGLGNFASLMRQAQEMGGKMQEINEELKSKRVTGNAGGGMIEVEVNGHGEVLRVKIDPTLQDIEMIESLLPAAVNDAAGKARELHGELMQGVTGDLNLAGLDEALAKFTGGN